VLHDLLPVLAWAYRRLGEDIVVVELVPTHVQPVVTVPLDYADGAVVSTTLGEHELWVLAKCKIYHTKLLDEGASNAFWTVSDSGSGIISVPIRNQLSGAALGKRHDAKFVVHRLYWNVLWVVPADILMEYPPWP